MGRRGGLSIFGAGFRFRACMIESTRRLQCRLGRDRRRERAMRGYIIHVQGWVTESGLGYSLLLGRDGAFIFVLFGFVPGIWEISRLSGLNGVSGCTVVF